MLFKSLLYSLLIVTGVCAAAPELAAQSKEDTAKGGCFDASASIAERSEVWIRIHIHAYRSDSCDGRFFGWEKTFEFDPEELYPRLHKLIAETNLITSKLSIAWSDSAVFGIPQAKEPAWLPLRFYVDGVTVHCDAGAQRLGNAPAKLRDRYPVAGTLNMHLVEWVGSSNGQAEGIGGDGATFTIESLTANTLIHEAMHLFNLKHAFENDGIDDTPVKRFQFDYNQDGDLDDYFKTTNPKCPAVGAERKWRSCWVIGDDSDGGPHYIDYDGDCVNDYTHTTSGHPCGTWTWQSNNIMDYSGYNNIHNAPALTAGQVARAMDNVASHRCAQIEYVGTDCPPANAQLFYTGDPDFEDVSFYAGLSQNDARYRLRLEDERGRRVYDTGWQRDTVPDVVRVAADPRQRVLGRRGKRLRAGRAYTAQLFIENRCGEERVAGVALRQEPALVKR